MSLAVFDITKYSKDGVVVEPVVEAKTGTIRWEKSWKCRLTNLIPSLIIIIIIIPVVILNLSNSPSNLAHRRPLILLMLISEKCKRQRCFSKMFLLAVNIPYVPNTPPAMNHDKVFRCNKSPYISYGYKINLWVWVRERSHGGGPVSANQYRNRKHGKKS